MAKNYQDITEKQGLQPTEKESIWDKLKKQLHERKSEKMIFGMPLYHIGRNAHGFFAIGFKARGVFSFGLISRGIFSVGLLSLGVISIGLLSLGLIPQACSLPDCLQLVRLLSACLRQAQSA